MEQEGLDRPYRVVELRQNTDEWLEWRLGGIGASEARVIARGRESKSWARLLREKCGEQECFGGNAATERGHELEPVARARFEKKVGFRVQPTCLQSSKHEWLRCSVDGLSSDGLRVVEIKCGERLHGTVRQASMFPKDLYAQLQHILAVTDLPSIDLFCHWPGQKDIHMHVARHDQWIENLMSLEQRFWLQLSQRKQ